MRTEEMKLLLMVILALVAFSGSEANAQSRRGQLQQGWQFRQPMQIIKPPTINQSRVYFPKSAQRNVFVYGGGAAGRYIGGSAGTAMCGPGPCTYTGQAVGGFVGGKVGGSIYDNPPQIPIYGQPYRSGQMRTTTPAYILPKSYFKPWNN